MRSIRKYLGMCLYVSIFVILAVTIVYASEDANAIKCASQGGDFLSTQSIGGGTSFVIATYAGTKASSDTCDISPYPAFRNPVTVELYAKVFNRYPGNVHLYFVVTDDGGIVVDLPSVTYNAGSSSVIAFCSSRSYTPGTYFVNILMDVPDGLLFSPHGYLFKVNP